MLTRILLFALLVAAANAKIGFFSAPHTDEHIEFIDTVNEEPLILTGMSPEAAREASRITGAGLDSSRGHSGFFVTDAKVNNTMFFWYVQPMDRTVDADKAPLLIWLQGGPGGSSMFGAFSEMGPYFLMKNGSSVVAVEREITWNDKYAMLFIDNPVGAGFSFTNSPDGYCIDTNECVARNLYSLLQQFYTVFPEKLHAELFVTGESYGGKYVPALAHYIHVQNLKVDVTKNVKIPLAGVAIGDGWTYPRKMIPAYADMMFAQGLISIDQREIIRDYCTRTEALMDEGKYFDAFQVWDKMLNGDIWPYGNLFHNMTGLNDYDNYMNTNAPESFEYYVSFLNQGDARRAFHVGNSPFPSDPAACEKHLLSDFLVSSHKELEVLMDNYYVLLYSGQLDVIIGAALTESFLPFLQWKGQEEFAKAERNVWRITETDSEVAGYVRQTKDLRFTYSIIRAAGHIAVYDQPARCRDMIERLVQKIPYTNLPNPRKH